MLSGSEGRLSTTALRNKHIVPFPMKLDVQFVVTATEAFWISPPGGHRVKTFFTQRRPKERTAPTVADQHTRSVSIFSDTQ